DFLRYALGEPDSAVPVQVSRYDSGMINHMITHLTFGSVQAICEGVWHISDAVPFRASFRADFDHATVDFNSMRKPDRLIVYTDKSETIIPLRAEEEKTVDNQMNISSLGAYLTEDRYFIRSILEGTPNEIAPLGEGIGSVRLCRRLLEQVR
ncbi:MAG: gfo/Idh/MocA family oxidoreductase, partial [Lachnospiraceae bacterium]|nr:gfo/Idh/MocA family oxidoreductase [Lachnospiraceae bacterium]